MSEPFDTGRDGRECVRPAAVLGNQGTDELVGRQALSERLRNPQVLKINNRVVCGRCGAEMVSSK
jgi:hypothetical protein